MAKLTKQKQVEGLEDDLAVLFTCTATEQVNDLVYVSANDTVAQADASDAAKSEVIGWVASKPSSTSCRVAFYPGPAGGASGLTAGNKVYLSPSTPGGATPTEPTGPDLIVEVGFAKNTTEFVFQRPVVIG